MALSHNISSVFTPIAFGANESTSSQATSNSSEIILNRKLLSSQARIQVPWVKVTIGDYTFGIFDDQTKMWGKDNAGFYQPFDIQYPNYIQALQVTKINGQVNRYELTIKYPITMNDDPNFFEKVFSGVSGTRKIIFTYGDAETPAYVYKNEEAIITGVRQTFDLAGSAIEYGVSAVSSAALSTDGNITMLGTGVDGKKVKPSDEIKKLFRTNKSLQDTFTGMSSATLNQLIAGDDMYVEVESKRNISAIDYINYLVGCMIPEGSAPGLSKEIYIMTIYDDSITSSERSLSKKGPYFEVKKVSTIMERGDAYEIDIGINTSTIVRSFQIEKNENYSIYYDYQNLAHPESYARRIGSDGLWEDKYAPIGMIKEGAFDIKSHERVWWTKATQFPVNATIQIQGLLRPATLMQYVKLNVIFPGGNKHLSSGLYIVTRQVDNIGPNGYATNLGLTRIKGDLDSINGPQAGGASKSSSANTLMPGSHLNQVSRVTM